MNSLVYSSNYLIRADKITKKISKLYNVVHPYDRSMAFISTWMWYMSYFADDVMKIIFRVLSVVSFLHWVDHDMPVFFVADLFMAKTVIVWTLLTSINQEDHIALEYLTKCLIIYIVNCLVLKGRKRSMQNYKIIYLIPHAAFRLYAYLAIMHLFGQYTTNKLCTFYWVTVFGSGLSF